MFSRRIKAGALVGAAALIAAAGGHANAQTIFSGTGAASGTAIVDFRAAIGGANNGGVVGSQPTGRRQITWDGVQLNGTDNGGNQTTIDPNKTIGIATTRFRNVGAVYQDIYAVSGDGFASVNPSTAGQFNAFSPGKTFAMFNDNLVVMSFVVPGTDIAAGTRGFGSIFLDMELANTSSIEYFNGSTSLGKYFVDPSASGESQFLGVLFDTPVVTSVALTLGNANLFSFDGTTVTPGGPEDLNGIQPIDLVVTDDFVFAEPQAVPEPSAVVLFSIGGLIAAGMGRRVHRNCRLA